MSRSNFKPKVVSLKLPDCAAVYFNPSACEWTADYE